MFKSHQGACVRSRRRRYRSQLTFALPEGAPNIIDWLLGLRGQGRAERGVRLLGPQGAAGMLYHAFAKVPLDSRPLPSAVGRIRSRGFRRNAVGGRGAGALTQTLGETPGNFARARPPFQLVNVQRVKKTLRSKQERSPRQASLRETSQRRQHRSPPTEQATRARERRPGATAGPGGPPSRHTPAAG